MSLPNNRVQAVSRLNSLFRSFRRKPGLKREFMAKLFQHGHAVPAPPNAPPHPTDKVPTIHQRNWYLPHFGVYHPKKPEQLRVVFDSAAEFQGVSLNKELIPGPGTINSLQGVLIRFRRENIAIMCDIERMFYYFYVNPDHRNTLRFLWYKDNDPTKEVVEYHMTVHLFGNNCSPAVATFGLRKTADEGEEKFGKAAKEFVHNDFYVDDGLTSRSTEEEAIDLVKGTQEMLATANILLHKIVSNSVKVMEAFPEQDRVASLRNIDLHIDPLPAQRSLGVYWDLESDTFTFRVSLAEKPYTRRGVLAIVNSIYDPLGFATPVTLRGRLLLRKLMAMGKSKQTDNQPLGWDDPLPEMLRREWQSWRDSLIDLESLLIPRCYHPKQFGDVKRAEIHSFSDASQEAIGVTIYLRLINIQGDVSVSLVFAQAKVSPKQATTTPRLELCGAVLSAQAVKWILKELKSTIDKIFFCTDSKVVLGYIHNESRRFYVYVANRVQIIRRVSEPSQWRYIDTATNPADLATRGVDAKHLKDLRWLEGPEFLSNVVLVALIGGGESTISNDDPEIRPQITTSTIKLQGAKKLNSSRFNRFSSWSSLRRGLVNLIVKAAELKPYRTTFPPEHNDTSGQHRSARQPLSQDREIRLLRAPSATELENAEEILIKTVQLEIFSTEVGILQRPPVLNSGNHDESSKYNLKKSNLYRLDPFLNDHGVLRVGGRLCHSGQEFSEKHPVILPKDHHIANLVINHYREKTHHQGRQITRGAIRQAGFWIVGASRTVSKVLKF